MRTYKIRRLTGKGRQGFVLSEGGSELPFLSSLTVVPGDLVQGDIVDGVLQVNAIAQRQKGTVRRIKA